MNSFALAIYSSFAYLDLGAPYSESSIALSDVTSSLTIRSNIATGMTNFTGQCFYGPYTPNPVTQA